MDRSHRAQSTHAPAGFRQCRAHQREVKDVVVEAAVFRIAECTGAELLARAGVWVAAEIMQRKNLVEVSEVIFAFKLSKVGAQMRERGDRARAVERSAQDRP